MKTEEGSDPRERLNTGLKGTHLRVEQGLEADGEQAWTSLSSEERSFAQRRGGKAGSMRLGGCTEGEAPERKRNPGRGLRAGMLVALGGGGNRREAEKA
jgi:hypothetical protein